jgi:hypothetical protein
LPFYGLPHLWYKFLTQTNSQLRLILKQNLDAFRELSRPYNVMYEKILPLNKTTIKRLLMDPLMAFDNNLFDLFKSPDEIDDSKAFQMYKAIKQFMHPSKEIMLWRENQAFFNYNMKSQCKQNTKECIQNGQIVAIKMECFELISSFGTFRDYLEAYRDYQIGIRIRNKSMTLEMFYFPNPNIVLTCDEFGYPEKE